MENNNKSGNNFFSGFLLGVFIGAGVVFLLGTERGKKLLKTMSEEGLDNISGILEEKKPSNPRVSKEQGKNFVQEKKAILKEKFIEEKPKVRRFFRGISRHLN